MKVSKLLKSSNLLYFLLTLVILNILYFLQTRNTRSLVILILIGLVTYSIKENWIVVFSVSLILTNCLFNRNLSYMEGMSNKSKENSNNNEGDNDDEDEEDSEEDSKEKNNEDKKKKEHEDNSDEAFVVDDSATLQASYENLQKFLDSPGFNKLTDETHKLAKSQDKLMKSLATLTPVLNDAKSSIGNLDLSTYGSLSDIIMNLGKKTN